MIFTGEESSYKKKQLLLDQYLIHSELSLFEKYNGERAHLLQHYVIFSKHCLMLMMVQQDECA